MVTSAHFIKKHFFKLKLKVLMNLRKLGKFHLHSICSLENYRGRGEGTEVPSRVEKVIKKYVFWGAF